MDALRRIAKAHPGERVLVITHGGLIRAIERELEIDSPYLANLGGLWVEVLGDEITVARPSRADRPHRGRGDGARQ